MLLDGQAVLALQHAGHFEEDRGGADAVLVAAVAEAVAQCLLVQEDDRGALGAQTDRAVPQPLET
jgi:hypothetical protein